MYSKLTFVSALIDLKELRIKDKSSERYYSLFEELVRTGINLCVYVSAVHRPYIDSICEKHSNVRLMGVVEYSEMETYKVLEGVRYELPNNRNIPHDTFNFMALMNNKVCFMNDVINKNPYESTHFAWIDFGIFHVFKDKAAAVSQLQLLSQCNLKVPCMATPGCWPGIQNVYNQINWRFCGGFMLGDADSIRAIYVAYKRFLVSLREMRRMIWEVNVWAIMEQQDKCNFGWFPGNHDNSIIAVPKKHFSVVASLTTIPSRIGTYCKLAIDSLLPQVDKVYLNVSTEYRRFPGAKIQTDYLETEQYRDKVVINWVPDDGPATKYRGVAGVIHNNQWVFVCDDDQEYHGTLIARMKEAITIPGVIYQNRYHIVRTGSGGIIHGYVGNMIYGGCLKGIREFEIPECARFVDDQWMSIFCHKNSIKILPTGIESYKDIYGVLMDNHEKWSVNSLAEIGNRDKCIREMADHFGIQFMPYGVILNKP